MFKLSLPWAWPWWFEKQEPQTLFPPEEWNQERLHFENSQSEPSPRPLDKALQLAPSFGDLKRLVL